MSDFWVGFLLGFGGCLALMMALFLAVYTLWATEK